MRWKLFGVLLLGLLVLSSFGSAGIGNSDKDKACQLVSYWVFENGVWVEKSEPRVWWYCQEPEKSKGFDGFAFKEMPYGLFKKPDVRILHQAARDLTDLLGIDELHGKFSKNLPSYGGMFINEEKGLIFVYVKDEKDKEKIKQALGKYKGKVNMVFLKGKYSFEQLVKWKKLMEKLDIKTLEKLGVTMIDADEAHNTLTIGLAEITAEKLTILKKELNKLGIPKEAVRVEKTGKMLPSASQTDVFDPLIGGIGIRVNQGYSSTCTLGFTAKINGENYFVTAGHCGEFGETGQSVYQPWGIGPWRKVGIVTKNPPLQYNYNWYPARYSDSLLVKVSGREIAPKIYSDWNVQGTSESYVGGYVCKVGITTQTTCGYITKTDSTSLFKHEAGYTYAILDTSEVSMECYYGDSGSPVFYKSYYTNDASMVGIVAGGHSEQDGVFTYTVFSEIDGIFFDLGNMEVSYSG